jgi:hypothetical protein
VNPAGGGSSMGAVRGHGEAGLHLSATPARPRNSGKWSIAATGMYTPVQGVPAHQYIRLFTLGLSFGKVYRQIGVFQMVEFAPGSGSRMYATAMAIALVGRGRYENS